MREGPRLSRPIPASRSSSHGPATNGKAVASPMAERGAVLQGAPRARPQGRALAKHLVERFQKRRGHRLGARKDRASTHLSHRVACERTVLRTRLSRANASPLTMKGLAILENLSSTPPVAGAFLEALSLLRSIPLPLVRARGAHGKTASHKPRAKPLENHLREGPRLSRPSPASHSSHGPATP